MVRWDLWIFSGEARNVSNQRLNRRVVIMVDKGNCYARRIDGKVQWTIDGEKTLMVGIEW